jgi:hypothetical protein
MIGTRKWIEKTSGNLSGLDRARVIATIIRLRLEARLRPAAAGEVIFGEFAVALPDSKLVKLATEECRDCCSTAIFNHSCRTYLWAAALANIGAVDHDPEELAVASLLHDLELGKVHVRSEKSCQCFAGAGAETADHWLKSHNVAPDMLKAITEAIALHLNPGVSLTLGATPHLLNIGAMADVVGTRMKSIPDSQREKVLASHPRSDFKREMTRHMQAEQLAAPNTRASFLMTIGFTKLVDKAPFES